MTAFKFDKFAGLLPRMPESLLPPTAATAAQNCEFTYGELRNVKGDFLLQAMANNTASLYTDTGLTFFSWTNDVNAVRSPLARDTFDRLYYTTPSDFRVTNRGAMAITGGQPGSSYRVGVPRPTAAPTMTVPAMPSLDNVNITAKFHYEYGGVKYQENDISLTMVLNKQKWVFTPPTKSTGAATTTGFRATRYYDPSMPPGWNPLENPNQQPIGWVALPANTIITPISNTSFTTNANVTIANATAVTDDFSKDHELETLFTMSQYALLKVLAGTPSIATPDQAFPVIRLIGKDAVSQDVVFDIYTANSSFTGQSNWELSIAKDDSGQTYTVTLASGLKEEDKETRAYIYTYVNTYNEEGPPSPAAQVTTGITMNVLVGVTKDAQTADYAPIKEIRIYRTPTGAAIADYFYVGAIAVLSQGGTAFTFSDSVAAAQLNEPLASLNYYAPDPLLVGLMTLPNGILCAWKGNELHFSEAYKPWAWPPQYVKTFTHNIVGGIAHGAGALITTIGQPFLISGVSPDTMTETKIKQTQAGVSKWSIADVGGILAYASNDGIVVVEGGQATLAYSEQFFTRDVWRAAYKNGFSSMRFAVWDGRLIVYSTAAAFTPFMIRLDESKGMMTELPSFAAACTFVSPISDQCYYVRNGSLYQFAGGTDLAASWVSREMVFNKPMGYGVAQAVCEGSWTVSFYADGALKHAKQVTGNETFRLPDGKADRWKIGLSGTGRFRELRVASTVPALKDI